MISNIKSALERRIIVSNAKYSMLEIWWRGVLIGFLLGGMLGTVHPASTRMLWIMLVLAIICTYCMFWRK